MNKTFCCTLAVLLSLIFHGCQNALSTGDDLLPEDDNISIIFNDTSTLRTTTVRSNPVRTDRLLFNHLGCMEDPLFGQTKANVSFELALPIVGLQKDTLRPLAVDSVVLSVVINDFYGDSSRPQFFKVYQVTQLEEKLVDYYSDEAPITSMVPIGSAGPIIPSLAKKVRVNEQGDTTRTTAILRFKLDNAIGELILNNLSNISSFRDFERILPGLMIAVDDGQDCGGGLYLLNLLSLNSNVRLHYHNVNNDTLVMFFPTFSSGFSRGEYSHQYENTEVGLALEEMGSNEEISYIQGLAGVQTRIDLPFIMNYSGSAINKAEIEVIQVYDNDSEVFTPPDRLYVTTRDRQGLIRNITDFSFGDSYYGGFRDSLKDENNNTIYRYLINISAHLQEIIDGKEENSSIYLTTLPEQVYDGGSTNISVLLPDRLRLAGSGYAIENDRIKLNLKYTEVQ